MNTSLVKKMSRRLLPVDSCWLVKQLSAVNVFLRALSIYQQVPENSGWDVNRTRVFGSFRGKISGSNGCLPFIMQTGQFAL